MNFSLGLPHVLAGGFVGGEAFHVAVGFAGDGVVVVERHDVGVGEGFVFHRRRRVGADCAAHGFDGDDAVAGPALVVVAPEGDPVMLLGDLPGAVVVDVFVFVQAAAPLALESVAAVHRAHDVAAKAPPSAAVVL